MSIQKWGRAAVFAGLTAFSTAAAYAQDTATQSPEKKEPLTAVMLINSKRLGGGGGVESIRVPVADLATCFEEAKRVVEILSNDQTIALNCVDQTSKQSKGTMGCQSGQVEGKNGFVCVPNIKWPVQILEQR